VYFSTERCLQCGRELRPTNLRSKYQPYLETDGEVACSGYWVCSIDCYEQAFREYMDKKYALDKTPIDDPDFETSFDKKRFAEGWRLYQEIEITTAQGDLAIRLLEESVTEADRKGQWQREQTANQQSEEVEDEWWTILKVSPDASLDEIKRSYHDLAKKCHPNVVNDLAPDLKELAEKLFKKLNAANEKAKRARASKS
jgi:DnaJ domain